MEVILLLIGVAVGAIIGYLAAKFNYSKNSVPIKEADEIKERLNTAVNEKGKAEERASFIEKSSNEFKTKLELERVKVLELSNQLSTRNADYDNLSEKLSEQKKELEQLHQKFSAEFKNLANEILEDKSKRFTEQNKSNLDEILKPLSEKIKTFEQRVNEVYVNETKERASLAEQIRNLHVLNQQMSKDANNLTRALKGDSKIQGNWGELILETILEKSGLVKDREYKIQMSFTSEEGRKQRPDVIIYLPESKNMIIDSKTSLTAYEAYCSSESDEDRDASLKEHITSLRNHIKNLNSKTYQSLYELQSLDFVLMFIPIEPAFALAMQNNPELFDEAFDRNIVIVCPSTLLATLRTIANIWKQERQNKNALEIARQSGLLFDKFTNFVEDLISLGKRLDGAKEDYEEAMKKLYQGQGNLVSKALKIKELGAKATKNLPALLVERADGDKQLFE
ncbi:MAG: DNA recombination protein RmuC [Ignavibacteriae bacterium]|nr:MAG: DNA recombination protein RmuC [Ignavibacteriota bacterium]